MATDRDVVRDNKEVYEWIRDNGHSDFVSLASECDAFAAGDQWDPSIKAKLARRRKPHLTVNKVLATVATLMGEHLVRRGDIAFRPASGSDPRTAQALDKLWMNFNHVQNYQWKEMGAFVDGIIRSRGFLDLRIDFDSNMRGEPVLSYMNSKDVMLYPGDNGMDPDGWTGVMLSRWLSPRDIAEIYRVPMKDILAFADGDATGLDYTDWKKDSFGNPYYDHYVGDTMQRAKYRLLRVLERQEWEYKMVECFVDIPTGETREIPTGWDRERIDMAMAQYGYGVVRRKVRKINWAVTVGEIKLHNAISPYRHLTPIPYFPFLIGGKPVGIVEQLRDPQNLLNKTLSQELHIVAGIANSGFKVKRGALANMTAEQLQERGGEDGIVIEYTSNPGDIEKLQPNQVPTGLDRLSYKAGEVMQQISLVNDSMMGLNRADEAGKAIEAKSQGGSTSLSPIYAALDQTRAMVARNWLDLTQQFVTEERAYYVTRNARTAEPEEVKVNQEQEDGSYLNDLTAGEFAIHISNIQSRDSYDMAQFDIMMQAMRQGAPIPWSEIINSLTILENRDAIVQFLKQQEGQTDPTEEQKAMQELERRKLEADVRDTEASADVKEAQADRARIEAAKKIDEDGGARAEEAKMSMEFTRMEKDFQMKQQDAEFKLQQMLTKADLDAKMAEQKLDAQRRETELKFQMMQEKHALEMEKLRAQIMAARESNQIKAEEAEIKVLSAVEQANIKQQQAEQKMELDRQTAAEKAEAQRQQAEQKMALAKRAAKEKATEGKKE